MAKMHSIHIDDDIYTLLKVEQHRRRLKIPLRHLVQDYIMKGIETGNFEQALVTHFENSENPQSFRQYLNSSFISDLIRLLDVTRPTYKDLASMNAALIYWNIEPREFFKTFIVYAKYGLSDLKED